MEVLLVKKSNNNVAVVGMQISQISPEANSLGLLETRTLSSCKVSAHFSCVCASDMGIILAGGDCERPSKERSKECHSVRVKRRAFRVFSTAQQPMHGNRDATAAACFFPPSLVFVAGGTREGLSTEVFHGGLNSWVNLITELPSPRTNHRLVANGDSVYCLGGKTTNVTRSCLRMSLLSAANEKENAQFKFPEMLEKLTWEPIVPMLYKRQSFGVLAHADDILVFGGSNGSMVRADIEAYSTHDKCWRALNKSMNIPRANPSVIVLEDELDPMVLILGGVDSEEKPVAEVEAIRVDALTNPESPAGFRVIGILKDMEAQDQYFPLRFESSSWEHEERKDPLIFGKRPTSSGVSDDLSRLSTTDGPESNGKGVSSGKYYKVMQMVKIVLAKSAMPNIAAVREAFPRRDPYDFYES